MKKEKEGESKKSEHDRGQNLSIKLTVQMDRSYIRVSELDTRLPRHQHPTNVDP